MDIRSLPPSSPPFSSSPRITHQHARLWRFCWLFLLLAAHGGPAHAKAALPAVNFYTMKTTVKEDAGSLSVVVTLSRPMTKAVQVYYNVGAPASGTAALAGFDYQMLPGEIDFPAGTVAASIPITLVNTRNVREAGRAFQLTLYAATSATTVTVGRQASHTVVIQNVNVPSVNFKTPAREVNEGAGPVAIPLSLDAASAKPVKVYYAVTGTAICGEDYQALTGEVDFAAQQTAATLSVNVLHNTADKNENRTLGLTLTSAQGASLGPNRTHLLSMLDIDPPGVSVGTLSTTGSLQTESRVKMAPVEVDLDVTLSKAAKAPLTVDFTVGGTAKPGVDYSMPAARQVAFAAGATHARIPITVIDNKLSSGVLTVTVTLMPNGTTVLAGGSLAYTLSLICGTTVDFVGQETYVAETAGSVSIPIKLSHAMTGDIPVSYTLSGSAVVGVNFTTQTLPRGRLIFTAGTVASSIVFPLLRDKQMAGLKTIVVKLSDPSPKAALGLNNVYTVYIQDVDQAAPKRLSAVGKNSSQPDMALDPKGDCHVVWRNISDNSLWYAKLDKKDNYITTPTQIYAGNKVFYPRVAGDAQGAAHVVFQTGVTAPGPGDTLLAGSIALYYLKITTGTLKVSRTFKFYPGWPLQSYNTPAIALTKAGKPVVAAEFHVSNGTIGEDGIGVATLDPDAVDPKPLVQGCVNATLHQNGGGRGAMTDVDMINPALAVDAGDTLYCIWKHKQVGWPAYSIAYWNSSPGFQWLEISSSRDVPKSNSGPALGKGAKGSMEAVWSNLAGAARWQSLSTSSTQPKLNNTTVSDVKAVATNPVVGAGYSNLFFAWVDGRTTSSDQLAPGQIRARMKTDLTTYSFNVSQSPAGASGVRMAARSALSTVYVWADSRTTDTAGAIYYRPWTRGAAIVPYQAYDPGTDVLFMSGQIIDPVYGNVVTGVSSFKWTLQDAPNPAPGAPPMSGDLTYKDPGNPAAYDPFVDYGPQYYGWTATRQFDLDALNQVFPAPAPFSTTPQSALTQADLTSKNYKIKYKAAYTTPNGALMEGEATGSFTYTPSVDITGVVTYGKTGQPLANVTVGVGASAKSLPWTALTDARGAYLLKNVPAQKAKVVSAQAGGYAQASVTLQGTSNIKLRVVNLTLQSKTSGPVITGARYKYDGLFFSGFTGINDPLAVFVDWGDAQPGKVQLSVDKGTKPAFTVTGDVNGGTFGKINFGTLFTSTTVTGTHTFKLIAIDSNGVKSQPFTQRVPIISLPSFIPAQAFQQAAVGGVTLGGDPTLRLNWPIVTATKTIPIPLLDRFGSTFNLAGGLQYKFLSGMWQIYLDNKPPDDGSWKWDASFKDTAPFSLQLGQWQGDLKGSGRLGGKATLSKGMQFKSMGLGTTYNAQVSIGQWPLAQFLPAWSAGAGQLKAGLAKFLHKTAPQVDKMLGTFKPVAFKGIFNVSTYSTMNSPLAWPASFGSLTLKAGPVLAAGIYPKVFDTAKVTAELAGQVSATVPCIPAYSLKTLSLDLAVSLKAVIKTSEWFKATHLTWDTSKPLPAAKPGLAPSATPGAPWAPVARDYGRLWTRRFAAAAPAPRKGLLAGSPAQTDVTIQENIYPNSDLALAAGGGRDLLLYVDDNPALTNPIQFTNIYWTYYDGTAWSTPAAIAAGTRGEFAPAVAFDGGGDGVALWERMRDPGVTNPDPAATAAQLDIVTARWDHATRHWSAPAPLTANLHLNHAPLICGPLSDGSLMAVWTENPLNLYQGAGADGATSNSLVRWTRWDAAAHAWSAPQTLLATLSGRTSQDLAGGGTTAVYAYTRLNDPADETATAQDVYYCRWDGKAWSGPTQLSRAGAPDMTVRAAVSPAGKTWLAWQAGGQLTLNEDLVTTATGAIPTDSEDYEFSNSALRAGPGGSLALVYQGQGENAANACYSIYDPAARSWSRLQTFLDAPALEAAYAPAWEADGTLTLACKRQALTYTTRTLTLDDGTQLAAGGMPTPGRADLVAMRHPPARDLALLDGDTTFTATTLQPGDTVHFTVQPRNLGDLAQTSVTVALYDGEPQPGVNEIARGTLTGWLEAGTSDAVSLDWTVPSPATDHVVYAVVDPDATVAESNRYNNRNFVSFGGTNLQLLGTTGETVVNPDGSAQLVVKAGNGDGPASDETPLFVRPQGQDGAALATATIPRLEAGECAEVALSLPPGTVPLGQTRTLTLQAGIDAGLDVELTNETDAAAAEALGTVVVQTTPAGAPWSLLDGALAIHRGTGTQTLRNVPVGPATLTWGEVANDDPPAPNPDTRLLEGGATLTFAGVYTRQKGTVIVTVVPAGVGWSLTDGALAVHRGTGSARLEGIPGGTIKLTWTTPAGYGAPRTNPASRTLTGGGTVTFSEVFAPLAAGPARNAALILRYLLGLESDSSGLDLNLDKKVDIADAIKGLLPQKPAP